MKHSILFRPLVAALLLAGAVVQLHAQGLDRRIASAAGSAVQFQFAARPGVCGDGRSFVRLDGDSWFGTMNDVTRSLPCEAGPVRVVVVRSGTEIIRIESYVGPVPEGGDATDLGRVAAGEAVAYLGGLATRGEGRVSRDALVPLGLADSARVTPLLLSLVRDADRPRETRRSALSWLVRRHTAADGIPQGEMLTLLTGLARSDSEHASFRQSALSMLGRLERGEGVPALIELSRATGDGWMARQSTEVLARSGDPRARRAVRTLVQDANASPDVRVVAMTGLANEYGSTADADVLIALYPALATDRLKEGALSGVASIGGTASRKFLLGLVRDESHPARLRRKASSLLERAGVPVRDVIGVYDGVSDGEVRVQLIELLAQAQTRAATDKLVSIAKEDTQPAARRRAISALGRSEDAAVREALKELVVK